MGERNPKQSQYYHVYNAFFLTCYKLNAADVSIVGTLAWNITIHFAIRPGRSAAYFRSLHPTLLAAYLFNDLQFRKDSRIYIADKHQRSKRQYDFNAASRYLHGTALNLLLFLASMLR